MVTLTLSNIDQQGLPPVSSLVGYNKYYFYRIYTILYYILVFYLHCYEDRMILYVTFVYGLPLLLH